MRNLLHTFHNVELFLRAEAPGGALPADACDALARRYTRMIDFYRVHDPESFRNILLWLEGLGFSQPPHLSLPLRTLSRFAGYENALRIRAGYRRLRRASSDP
ncbi:MAG TPA: hypothetical protein VJV79_07410 [Polyangiaceae bacterium]|nr:hypothetical protein [Polyangiaceae bacterium]